MNPEITILLELLKDLESRADAATDSSEWRYRQQAAAIRWVLRTLTKSNGDPCGCPTNRAWVTCENCGYVPNVDPA